MTRIHHLIPALLATAAQAGELTLEEKPFHIVQEFSATALPAKSTPIRIDPDAWSSFKIVSISEHASNVKKGDPLVVFETEDIDKKITELKRSVEVKTLELAQAELALATLEKTLPEKLKRLERSADAAAEELAYFIGTRRKASEESAAVALKRQEQILASVKEELKQLLQMYEADDITEDTEEIILKNQRDQVAYQQFALRMEILNHKRTIEVSLPRQEISLTEKRDDTALSLAEGQKELPRAISLEKLEIAGLKTALSKLRESLKETEKDRTFFEIKAPSNGIFYYGVIEDGKWITGDLIKTLEPGGNAPTGKTFATFIPAGSEMSVIAFSNQDTAAALTTGIEATATLQGREDLAIPVKLSQLSNSPGTDGSYAMTFSATWPKEASPAAGQSLTVRAVSYSAEKAITVPKKALTFGPQGWTIEVKLADGKTEERIVTRGKDYGDNTQILAGLEAGQVIIVP
ncbi:MAG: hypothetical protein ACSHX9_04405 [Luteolibacter sp.]